MRASCRFGVFAAAFCLAVASCDHKQGGKAGDAGALGDTGGSWVDGGVGDAAWTCDPSMQPDGDCAFGTPHWTCVPNAGGVWTFTCPAPPDGGQTDAAIDATDAAASPETGRAETGRDGATVRWPGLDATITLGSVPVPVDGGRYPPVYAFPGVAMVSHNNLFSTEPDLSFRIDEVGKLRLVDLDGDHRDDVVVSKATSLSCYVQDAKASFRSVRGITLPTKAMYDRIEFGDFNGDGLMDIVLVRYLDEGGYYHAQIVVHLQTADGFRDEPDAQIDPIQGSALACDRTYFLTADDMNGDGHLDIIALTQIDDHTPPATMGCSYARAVAQIFLQAPGGTFSLATELEPRSADALCRACAVSLATGDSDGDGERDLAVIQDGQYTGSGAPLHGHEVLVYPRKNGTVASAPTQVLKLSQYLKTVKFVDVDGNGRLDLLVRAGDWGEYEPKIDLSGATVGLSGVFLQKDDGTFDSARTLTPDGWLPADTDSTYDPIGIDIRDVDRDGTRDLVLERKSVVQGLFRQEQGLFATTPDLDVPSLFPDLVAASKRQITVTYQPNSSVVSSTGLFNKLAYAVADMDGDGRQDIVSAYAPFAPNLAPDPATGTYPYPGFQPNTYTEIRIHRQRSVVRSFRVEIEPPNVATDEGLLKIRATVHNQTSTAAEAVLVRVLAAPSPLMFTYTLDMLATDFDRIASWGIDWMNKNENQIKGTPLGPDILIPRIEAGDTIPVAIDVPVALVNTLDVYCLFLLVDADQSTNLLYKRKYDFIAP
jgi:hypothetical protein